MCREWPPLAGVSWFDSRARSVKIVEMVPARVTAAKVFFQKCIWNRLEDMTVVTIGRAGQVPKLLYPSKVLLSWRETGKNKGKKP